MVVLERLERSSGDLIIDISSYVLQPLGRCGIFPIELSYHLPCNIAYNPLADP